MSKQFENNGGADDGSPTKLANDLGKEVEKDRIRRSFYDQFRRTFVAGLFASVPLCVTAFIVYWIDAKTRVITAWVFDKQVPFLGVLIALVVIYLVGMVTTSLVGRVLLHMVDSILIRLPIIRQIYQGWKQIALTPGGTEGTFSKVALIPDEAGLMKVLGFTSGRIVQAPEPSMCVFVPFTPNPITGRLYFVPVQRCQIIDMSAEEAFKVILSLGNYVPPFVPLQTVTLAEYLDPAVKLPATSGVQLHTTRDGHG